MTDNGENHILDRIHHLDEHVLHQLVKWPDLGRRKRVMNVEAFFQYFHLCFTLINKQMSKFYGPKINYRMFWLECRLYGSHCDLTLLAEHQEVHPACKNWALRCWHGCLSRAKYNCFVLWTHWCHCHPIISCFIKIQTVFCISAASLLRLT